MTQITDEMLAHISARNGDLAKSIATYREVSAQLDALNAHPSQSIQVTVHVAGKNYSMRVIVQVLRAQLEADMAILARRIREAAAVPFDWVPVQPPMAYPTQATTTTEGTDHHV